MKYIDADKLIAEIEQRIKNFSIIHNTAALKKDYESISRVNCVIAQLRNVLAFAKSLQQEQPEADLEREIEEWWQNWVSPPRNEYAVFNKEEFINIVRHFYELGRNAKKEK